MPMFKRISDNSISEDNLKDVYDAIRMRDEDGHPLAYINTDKLHLEFRRASLRHGYIEADVRIYAKK